MNKELILNVVKPHLNSKNELTYSDFDDLFSSLENQEKYSVCNLLIDSGIELVDEKSIEDTCTNKLLYENPDNKPKTIIIKKENLDAKSTSINKTKSRKKFNTYKYESNEFLVELYQKTGKEEVLNALIDKNQKYIFQKANQVSYYYNHNLSDEDLNQIATIGFICGCKRFDTTKGYNLLTYATFWIKQILRREIIDTGFLIRLPVHKWESINRVNKIMAKYSSDKDIDIILEHENISNKILEDVVNLKHNYLNPDFLDSQIYNESDISLLDTISDDTKCLISRVDRPEKMIEDKELEQNVISLLNQLSGKERDVLSWRFGFTQNADKLTLKEIGQKYGVSRERIRQIEARALVKLKKLCKSKKIEKMILDQIETYTTGNTEFEAKYLFKNKEGSSYIPEISEIIKRVLKLFPEEINIDILYEKICICANQNSYKVSSLSKDNIICKLKEYLNKRSS